MIRPPSRPAAVSAVRIVRGAVRRGLWVSSLISPALSKPIITYAAVNEPTSSAPRSPPSRLPVVWKVMLGVRFEWVRRRTTIRIAPMISAVTPTRLITDITRLSRMFTRVVRTSRITPRTAALAAPSGEVGAGSPPTSWKPDQIAGRTICRASAAAATTTIWPITMIQPANQPKVAFERRDDHW